MSKEGIERLVEAINGATGSKMSVIGSGFAVKVINEKGRSMLSDGFVTPQELCNRAEAVLYFVQRGGVQQGVEKGSGGGA